MNVALDLQFLLFNLLQTSEILEFYRLVLQTHRFCALFCLLIVAKSLHQYLIVEPQFDQLLCCLLVLWWLSSLISLIKLLFERVYVLCLRLQ